MDTTTQLSLEKLLNDSLNAEQLPNVLLQIGSYWVDNVIPFDMAYMLIDSIIQTYYSKVLCPQIERVSIDSHREYLKTVKETIQNVSNLIHSSFHHDAFQSPEWTSSLNRITHQIPIYLTPILSETFLNHFSCYCNECLTTLVQCESFAPSSNDSFLLSLLQLIAPEILTSYFFQTVSQYIQSQSILPSLQIIRSWMVSQLPVEDEKKIASFLNQCEIDYFVNHFLQIVDSYPHSIHSIHFTCNDFITYPDSYLNDVESIITGMKDQTVDMIVYYTKMVCVCWNVGLPNTLTSFLLSPLQKAIRKQPNWIQSLFFVISRDYSELLTRPPSSMDKRDDWGINRLRESSQQPRQSIDLFSFFVEIEESVESFITECATFFMNQLLYQTEETENTKSMERLLLFVIRQLGREDATKLIGILRDVRISHIFNHAFHSKTQAIDDIEYSCSIYSRCYWPLQPSTFFNKLPDSIITQQKRIEKFYRKGYKNQSLKVLSGDGFVELNVKLKNESRSFQCSIKEYYVLDALHKDQYWTVSDLSNQITLPMADVLNAIHSLQVKGLVICVKREPPTYRRVNYWNEIGIELSSEEVHTVEVLEQLKRYERFIVEILNMCTDFDVHKLYERLKKFLQGPNKFSYSEDDLCILIEDMKKRDILYEDHSILKLRNYYG